MKIERPGKPQDAQSTNALARRSYFHSIVTFVHIVVPRAISSMSCYLALNRPNQI